MLRARSLLTYALTLSLLSLTRASSRRDKDGNVLIPKWVDSHYNQTLFGHRGKPLRANCERSRARTAPHTKLAKTEKAEDPQVPPVTTGTKPLLPFADRLERLLTVD